MLAKHVHDAGWAQFIRPHVSDVGLVQPRLTDVRPEPRTPQGAGELSIVELSGERERSRVHWDEGDVDRTAEAAVFPPASTEGTPGPVN